MLYVVILVFGFWPNISSQKELWRKVNCHDIKSTCLPKCLSPSNVAINILELIRYLCLLWKNKVLLGNFLVSQNCISIVLTCSVCLA